METFILILIIAFAIWVISKQISNFFKTGSGGACSSCCSSRKCQSVSSKEKITTVESISKGEEL